MCLCYHYRCAMPCDDDVPCMIALCGLICFDGRTPQQKAMHVGVTSVVITNVYNQSSTTMVTEARPLLMPQQQPQQQQQPMMQPPTPSIAYTGYNYVQQQPQGQQMYPGQPQMGGGMYAGQGAPNPAAAYTQPIPPAYSASAYPTEK
jgi:hypothetical protein